MQLIILSILLLAAGASLVSLIHCRESFAESSVMNLEKSQQAPRYDTLTGRWRRPDGGYILEIKDVSVNGTLDAAYFNPNLIHVANSKASLADEKLKIFIELRDVNYPGSIYNLTYDPMDDRLKGTYFQAVAKETYRVFFIRVKP